MLTVNVHAAKTTFSKLLRRVARGEEIIVAKAGKPVAKIVPIPPPGPRRPGSWRGKFTVPKSFFDSLPEDELRRWEG